MAPLTPLISLGRNERALMPCHHFFFAISDSKLKKSSLHAIRIYEMISTRITGLRTSKLT
jgi:hypothetical protein